MKIQFFKSGASRYSYHKQNRCLLLWVGRVYILTTW